MNLLTSLFLCGPAKVPSSLASTKSGLTSPKIGTEGPGPRPDNIWETRDSTWPLDNWGSPVNWGRG